jgi:ATP-dependent Zn protease
MVLQLPERDHRSTNYEQMTARLAIMMGGRVAEEIIFGANKVTSGAESDIKQATQLARMTVTRWAFRRLLVWLLTGRRRMKFSSAGRFRADRACHNRRRE